jgi:hypothetical protein
VKAGLSINAGAAVVAARLAASVRDIVVITLPARLRAWDGSEAGPPGGPVLVICSRRALARGACQLLPRSQIT